MSDLYEEIKSLIVQNPDIVEFADFGNGISKVWISKAESVLNIKFPPSYVWWLTNYGGGEICGEEVFSIYEQDFDSVVGGDIVYVNKINQDTGLLSKNQIAICESDLDGIFYFDFNQVAPDGEVPIYLKVTGEIYACNFLVFVKKRILIALSN